MTGRMAAYIAMAFVFIIAVSDIVYKSQKKGGSGDSNHREFVSRLANRPFNR